MRAVICIYFATFLHHCLASEEQLTISPDKRFAVSSKPGEYPQLVSFTTHTVVKPDILDEQARTIFVLWSEDSKCVVCWVQQARVTAISLFRRKENSFQELIIPKIVLPFESSLKEKETRCIGETDSPTRWLSKDALLMNRQGTINYYEGGVPNGGFDYSYDITIQFDEKGMGHVLKIKKATSH